MQQIITYNGTELTAEFDPTDGLPYIWLYGTRVVKGNFWRKDKKKFVLVFSTKWIKKWYSKTHTLKDLQDVLPGVLKQMEEYYKGNEEGIKIKNLIVDTKESFLK